MILCVYICVSGSTMIDSTGTDCPLDPPVPRGKHHGTAIQWALGCVLISALGSLLGSCVLLMAVLQHSSTSHHMSQANKSARPPGTLGFGALAHTVLFQNKAKVVRSGLEAPTTVHQRIRTVNLPQDVLEIIVSDIGDDVSSLKAFSVTCYSWYLAAVPHLHRTLTLEDRSSDPTRTELKPLAKLHKMDLLLFVKKLWIRSSSFEPWLSPRKFDRQTLRYFCALTNVQKLRIERFDLSKFMPGIERSCVSSRCFRTWTTSKLSITPPRNPMPLQTPAPKWQSRFPCPACGVS
ncbi:hypothetical protein BDM02DRAFT_2736834 [Thelephora ganbajun]|uniref:Uncharacterized protein n=1 Tax=Thelephora ganbajun TaxID=370292 RepID=A0ACB6ZCL3_THEGA|nr:hypothetical protein BDM02DRAFT_2736834 [Thelephora ganbajun]